MFFLQKIFPFIVLLSLLSCGTKDSSRNNPLNIIYQPDSTLNITTDTKLSEARKLFIENKIHHLPVVQGDNELAGILSYNDLLRVDSGTLYNQDPKQTDALIDNIASVSETMTKDIKVLKTNETVRDATEALYKGKFHSLPVLEDNKIVGLVTSTDLLKYFLGQY